MPIAAMAGGHAVELVNEAAGYAQRRIQRKQAGQAVRLPGIDPSCLQASRQGR